MDKPKIQKNIKLKNFTTLRLGGAVSNFIVVKNELEIKETVLFAKKYSLPIFPLGGGSNLVVLDKVNPMLVVKMKNIGIEIILENSSVVKIKVLAGTIWDDFVNYTVENQFSGIEALSAIPGTCGATPVQNVGAYGSDVSQTIYSVRYYDTKSECFKQLKNKECHFKYRDSIFKNKLKGKCIIESVIFKLKKSEPIIPDYPKVADVLIEMKKDYPNKSLNYQVRKTIQKIRSEKLPDPKKIASAGSFFKNSFVSKKQMTKILKKFPNIPHYISGHKYKIPAGWLIEQVGMKGFSLGGVGVYEKNALVLINKNAKSSERLLDLAYLVQKKVFDQFGIRLEIEPEVI